MTGPETDWAERLRAALLPLADELPRGLSGSLADPADDGPVILAWGVDQLAEAIANNLAPSLGQTRVEWGIRRPGWLMPSDATFETREAAERWSGRDATVVRRTVTVSPWEDA